MSEPRAQRTLVKSPPELWAEISDVSLLARHLGEFGDIRITRLEAETTVVWEGDRARGTVELEASGWGTKVTITAEAIAVEEAPAVEHTPPAEAPATEIDEAQDDAVAEAEPDAEAPPAAAAEQEAAPEAAADADVASEPAPAPRRRGFLRRLFGRRTAPVAEVAAEPEPVAEVAPEPEVEPEPVAEVVAQPEPAPVVEPELAGEIVATAAMPLDDEQVEAVLVGVLDDLGSAHHRPFSRG